MAKTHVKELVDSNQQVIATFWFDGKKVQANPPDMLDDVAEMYPNNKSVKDGIEFLKALPFAFRSGYMFIRSKPDEV